MYAVIATGGKQFKVQEKDVVAVERLAGEIGTKVTFSQVLAMGEGAEIKVGTPVIEGAKVEAEIIDQFRGPKLIAFKMKRRKGYRKRKGHRQELTKVRILSIA
ncbi:MAG: 50S ribosomal protein L21 [Lentisphaeria bacterium]|nr:50S ribosomal protein L21 [Lentisphaerota bacterium]MBO5201148.1 50S ribosomal protein L21 [Lentisphaeria bacterium]MBO5694290.1 50S ribosomal protein L21 [Lentisphaeria bacterium]MBO5960184.1 50S ribosomal protein L21 [Lentisphaeria bacterium]MBQ7400609.1 50S ribosomal protein L21 [Lentisphaeria bacterium]